MAGLGAGTAVHGVRLRAWGLSEVWRVGLAGPPARSVVVKRGAGEMADEVRRYRRLVLPLGAPAPRLLAATGGGDGTPGVLVLEDVGGETLEQRPGSTGFPAAVRALAALRGTAARRLDADPTIGAGLRMTDADLLDAARRAEADRMVTGGLCWTVLALRWLAEEGLRAVPGSRDWVDGLVTDCRDLARIPAG